TRYDGAIGNSLLVDAAFTWGWNFYKETPASNVVQIFDNTQIAAGQRGSFNAQGIGIVEPYDGNTRGVNGDITKTVHLGGTHSINFGYTWQFAQYNDHTFWSGDRFVVPDANFAGNAPGRPAFTDFVSGKTTDANFNLNLVSNIKGLTAACTVCPYLDVPGVGFQQVALAQSRGRFDGGVTVSSGKYHAAYIN